jgi:hypothetical protein
MAILHLVGRRWELAWGPPWESGPATRLVVIGLAHAVTQQGIEHHFVGALQS